MPFHDACWAVQVDPQEIEDQMVIDPHVRCGFRHRIALHQYDLIQVLKQGGRGLSPAKVALEQLTAQHKSWAKASAATLAKQFEDALESLKKIFEPKDYEKIVRVLERFS